MKEGFFFRMLMAFGLFQAVHSPAAKLRKAYYGISSHLGGREQFGVDFRKIHLKRLKRRRGQG